jgi:hypothetical protein
MKTKQEYTLEQRLMAVALFDGWTKHKLHNNNPIKDYEGADYYDHKNYPTIYVANYFQDIHWTTQLRYNTSWDWLMSVVEKIESIPNLNVYMNTNYCEITKSSWNIKDESFPYYTMIAGTRKETTFLTISNFCIEWCNQNNIKID